MAGSFLALSCIPKKILPRVTVSIFSDSDTDTQDTLESKVKVRARGNGGFTEEQLGGTAGHFSRQQLSQAMPDAANWREKVSTLY